MSVAEDLLKSILQEEKELRECLKSNPSTSTNCKRLRQSILQNTETFLSMDAELGAVREIEHIVWKPCFYAYIGDFRRQIRKYASSASSDQANARTQFHKISAAFEQFLDEATSIYERMYGHFWKALQRSDNAIKLRQSCHRCLIFLGDLARYRELHNQKSRKDFSSAKGYYHRALVIMPENGNPHNQLAVIATYDEAEFIAVYRYCRSLMVQEPFETSKENLVMIFEKNRQQTDAMTSKASTKMLTKNSPPAEKSSRLKLFLSKMNRLHGIIFTSLKKDPKAFGAWDEGFVDLVFKDFDELLSVYAIGDALLLQLIVVCIFTLVNTSRESSSTTDDLRKQLTAKVIEVTYRTLISVLEAEHESFTEHNSKYLGPASILLDFFRLHPQHLHLGDDHYELRESFLKSLSKLLNAIQKSGKADDTIPKWHAKVYSLKETIELRGFTPLKDLKTIYYCDMPSLHAAALSQVDSLPIRLNKLMAFGNFLCSDLVGNGSLLQCVEGLFQPTVEHALEVAVGMNFEDLAREVANDDDLDDEVIVFQPRSTRTSLTLVDTLSAQSVAQSSSSSSSSLKSTLGSSFLGGNFNAVLNSSPKSALESNIGSGMSEKSGGISSITGITGISGGGSGGDSTSIFNSFGWGGIGVRLGDSKETSHAVDALGFTANKKEAESHYLFGSPINSFDDLLAIEKECDLYENEASSLMGFSDSFCLPSSAKSRTNTPPPGFGQSSAVAPPGFKRELGGQNTSRTPSFFTNNSFSGSSGQ